MGNGVGRAVLRGSLASVAGILAMDRFFKSIRRVGAQPADDDDRRSNRGERRLDDISLVGRSAKEGEPSTQAVGRLAYRALKGEDPPESTHRRLGTAVHWGYGMAVGALFGLLRPEPEDDGVLGDGLGYGTALWLFGDELAVPLLGLAKGPTAVPARTHAEALGAHLAYGLATASATKALRRVL